jgi:hypothetical protein
MFGENTMKNATEIIIVLDRSGSMEPMREETIKAFDAFIEEQKQLPDPAYVTLVQFDHEYEKLIDRVPLQDVGPLVGYEPRGWTALLDAIGRTTVEAGAALAALPENDRPDKVLFVVITDGEENSSQEYTPDQIKSMREHQENKYSWKYVFLASDVKVSIQAVTMGFSADYTSVYGGDIQSGIRSLSASTAQYRSGGDLTPLA